MKHIILALTLIVSLTSTATFARETELPLPRFVTIKASEANARTGPSRRYPIQNVYTRSGLPVEITAEFGNWRKIVDIDGEEGWVHENLLSGKRNAFIIGDEPQLLYNHADKESLAIIRLAPKVIVNILSCEEEWCKIKADDYTGYITRDKLWGVYESEDLG